MEDMGDYSDTSDDSGFSYDSGIGGGSSQPYEDTNQFLNVGSSTPNVQPGQFNYNAGQGLTIPAVSGGTWQNPASSVVSQVPQGQPSTSPLNFLAPVASNGTIQPQGNNAWLSNPQSTLPTTPSSFFNSLFSGLANGLAPQTQPTQVLTIPTNGVPISGYASQLPLQYSVSGSNSVLGGTSGSGGLIMLAIIALGIYLLVR
jgi:hypothetical protein